jgi:membrane associated rhomboid family serine protease
MPITYIIIGFTVLMSMWAFSDHNVFHRLKHYPYAEARHNEHFRWITGGLLHGDYGHLLFNMITLYFFGPLLEQNLAVVFPGVSKFMFVLFYVLALVASSSASYMKHKDNPHYAAIGASGATAAVLFACILFIPTIGIMMFFIPIPIPGIIFGPLYLWYSSYAEKRGGDNIGHLAHYYGAIFGFVFPLFFKPGLLLEFIAKVMAWLQGIF